MEECEVWTKGRQTIADCSGQGDPIAQNRVGVSSVRCPEEHGRAGAPLWGLGVRADCSSMDPPGVLALHIATGHAVRCK